MLSFFLSNQTSCHEEVCGSGGTALPFLNLPPDGVFIFGCGLQKLPTFNYILYIRVRENSNSMFSGNSEGPVFLSLECSHFPGTDL
jgi:hypothetical protein